MQSTAPYWIEPTDESCWFPDPALALEEPDGLLAVGGNLHPQRLLLAYSKGIFPWYNHDQPILWWSPNPRAVLYPHKLKVSRSLRKQINKACFVITADKAFHQVIRMCAEPRAKQQETWITQEMEQAYLHLHQLGFAHSIECWQEQDLVGGLYGIAIGKVFFGESMFSRTGNASKVAFYYLIEQLKRWQFQLVDCQVASEHLSSLGAENIRREQFLQILDQYCNMGFEPGSWQNSFQTQAC